VDDSPAASQVAGPGARLGVGRAADRTFKYWAVAPALAVLALLALYPALELVYLSAGSVRLVGSRSIWTFVGLANVQTMLHDPVVPIAFRNTLVFVVVVVAIEAVIGLGLAVLVSRTRRIGLVYRAVLIIPILVPGIASATMWRLMLDYNYGVVDAVLLRLHLPAPTWTADPNLALVSVMLVDVWHWTSFFFLIFLAGVESLPAELFEAARIDGAGEWRLFRNVMLPLLLPTIAGVMALRTIFAFKVFDEVFVLTGGGPGASSQVISVYIYQVYFDQFRTGYGALLALVTAVLVAGILLVYQRTLLRGARTLAPA
jgi:multiple sugar transport system permease protein